MVNAFKTALSGGVSYGAQAANPNAQPVELAPPTIRLNRQNRRRRRHDARRMVQRVLQEAKVSKLRQFWKEMFA